MNKEYLNINECPYCKSDEGYFFRSSYRGTYHERYNFNGEMAEESGDIHDYATYKQGKIAYCRNCGKKLFKVNNSSEFYNDIENKRLNEI
ncbi:TPA: hypothetical protein I9092_000757 [Clostridium perfringens]|uniref:Uncharacterized protein n=1 Tax=Clostridium perfringens TaxID=1502 RepID=A0AB37C707_CLOPF|nr:hypothetical protein [Clostridium perfringens]AQW27845.1 hypothetical protein BXT94_14020 [Clostridium perfringens]ASY52531.1 hypothetical protein BG908_12930 [Clostridium perfringens]AWS24109.1 hypothetical protein CYK96_00020 [Clostridium perfringens]KQC93162.1 hypothetical protein AM596_05830 [Clostridium perfringens CP4]MBO3423120.1 hypothetical protein [Clostridium perfringens]